MRSRRRLNTRAVSTTMGGVLFFALAMIMVSSTFQMVREQNEMTQIDADRARENIRVVRLEDENGFLKIRVTNGPLPARLVRIWTIDHSTQPKQHRYFDLDIALKPLEERVITFNGNAVGIPSIPIPDGDALELRLVTERGNLLVPRLRPVDEVLPAPFESIELSLVEEATAGGGARVPKVFMMVPSPTGADVVLRVNGGSSGVLYSHTGPGPQSVFYDLSISADRTSGLVGETFTFSGRFRVCSLTGCFPVRFTPIQLYVDGSPVTGALDTTDANGEYVIPHSFGAPGTYQIFTRAVNYNVQSPTITVQVLSYTLTLSSDKTTGLVNEVFTFSGELRLNGQGISNEQIQLYANGDPIPGATDITDQQGRYSIQTSFTAAGSFQVQAKADALGVGSNIVTINIEELFLSITVDNATKDVGEVFTFSGQFRRNGTPIPNALIQLYVNGDPLAGAQNVTEQDGSYEVQASFGAPGTYQIFTRAVNYNVQSPTILITVKPLPTRPARYAVIFDNPTSKDLVITKVDIDASSTFAPSQGGYPFHSIVSSEPPGAFLLSYPPSDDSFRNNIIRWEGNFTVPKGSTKVFFVEVKLTGEVNIKMPSLLGSAESLLLRPVVEERAPLKGNRVEGMGQVLSLQGLFQALLNYLIAPFLNLLTEAPKGAQALASPLPPAPSSTTFLTTSASLDVIGRVTYIDPDANIRTITDIEKSTFAVGSKPHLWYVENGNRIFSTNVAPGETRSFTVRLKEEEGIALLETTKLVIRLPPGWRNVQAANDQDGGFWGSTGDDPPTLKILGNEEVGWTITVFTKDELKGGFRDFTFTAQAPSFNFTSSQLFETSLEGWDESGQKVATKLEFVVVVQAGGTTPPDVVLRVTNRGASVVRIVKLTIEGPFGTLERTLNISLGPNESELISQEIFLVPGELYVFRVESEAGTVASLTIRP